MMPKLFPECMDQAGYPEHSGLHLRYEFLCRRRGCGGGMAPAAIGIISVHYNLGIAISLAGLVYVVAGILLLIAGVRFAPGDVARYEGTVRAEIKS